MDLFSGLGVLFLFISLTFIIIYYIEVNKYQEDETNKTKSKLNDICVVNNTETPQVIYSDRPTVTFKKMFLEPSIWLGYETVTQN